MISSLSIYKQLHVFLCLFNLPDCLSVYLSVHPPVLSVCLCLVDIHPPVRMSVSACMLAWFFACLFVTYSSNGYHYGFLGCGAHPVLRMWSTSSNLDTQFLECGPHPVTWTPSS